MADIEFTTDLTPTYEDKVGAAMLALPEGGVFELAANVKPETREQFIAVIKSYIDRNLGAPDWELIFSNDYTKIKKQKLWKNEKRLWEDHCRWSVPSKKMGVIAPSH
jgi:hypothetical protein